MTFDELPARITPALKKITPFDYTESKLHAEAVLSASRLTDREKTVLTLLLDDLTVRKIGDRLGISHVMVVKLKCRIYEEWMCLAA